MRRLIVTTMVGVLVLAATAAQVSATDGGDQAPNLTNPKGGVDLPPSGTEDQDAGKAPGQDQAGPDDDLMKNFTRHRPGACPEGPPCKVED
jgi:hypothetical protein